MIEGEREKERGKTESGDDWGGKMHKYKQIRAEWLYVGMPGRVGGNDREEDRGLNFITALQILLYRLELVELNVHG